MHWLQVREFRGERKSFGVVRTCGVFGEAPVWEFVAGIRGYDVVGWIGKKFLAGIGLIGSAWGRVSKVQGKL